MVAPKKKRVAKLNPVLVAAEIVHTGGNISQIAKRFGVCRKAVQKHVARHPELQEHLDNARERRLDMAEEALRRFMDRDDRLGLIATIFFLKTQGKARGYLQASRVEVANPEGQTFKTDGALQVSLPDRIEQLNRLFAEHDGKLDDLPLGVPQDRPDSFYQ